jgi:hypothetical protein
LNIFNIALLHYFVLLLVVVERRRRPSSSCCSPASTFSLSLQTLITGRRVFPVRRSAVRFATLKRRLRFNAYFSFLCLFVVGYIRVSPRTNNNNTLVSPKCLRNFFSFCLLFVVVVSSVSLFFCLFAHYFRHIFAFSP